MDEYDLLYTQEDLDEWMRTCEELQEKITELKEERNDYKQRYESAEKRYEQLVQSGCEALEKKGKETAREIIEMLVPPCEVCDENWHKGCLCFRAKIAKKIAKQYGVEVEE